MKIFHIGDPHLDYDPIRMEKAEASTRFIEETAHHELPDLIIIPGDLFHRRQYVDAPSVALAISHITSLASVAPVAMVYGNAEHDQPQSLDFIRNLRTDNPVYLADRAESIVLTGGGAFAPVEPGWDGDGCDALIHLMPYPTKAWYLAGKNPTTIDEANQEIRTALLRIFQGMGALSQGALCPVVFGGHLNVLGSKLSTGQTLLGQDIVVSRNDLLSVGAHYYALNHIHMAQEVGPNMHYAGSTYHVNHGETEDKVVYMVEVERTGFVGGKSVKIPSRPLSHHELHFDAASGTFVDAGVEDWIGADLRVRVYLTKEQELPEEEVKARYLYAASYQIEYIRTPEERTQRSEIVRAKSLREKVEEYSRATGRVVDKETYAIADEIERAHTL